MKVVENIKVREFDVRWNMTGAKVLTKDAAESLKGKRIFWSVRFADGNYRDVYESIIGEFVTDKVGYKYLTDINEELIGLLYDEIVACSDRDRPIMYMTEEDMEQSHDISRMEELADFINESEDYPLSVEGICETNGWELCTRNEFDVCKSIYTHEILTMDENSGAYVVKPYNWGGKREGAGRKTLYSEKKQVKIYLTAEAIELLASEQQNSGLSRSDIVNRIILEKYKSEA